MRTNAVEVNFMNEKTENRCVRNIISRASVDDTMVVIASQSAMSGSVRKDVLAIIGKNFCGVRLQAKTRQRSRIRLPIKRC